jgi:hypothetical protein
MGCRKALNTPASGQSTSEIGDHNDPHHRQKWHLQACTSQTLPTRRTPLEDNDDIEASRNVHVLHPHRAVAFKPWPEHRIARGYLTVRTTPSKRSGGVTTWCNIEHSLMTIAVESTKGEGFIVDIAKVATHELIVTLYPGCLDMFRLATDGGVQVYCFALDQEKRNKWVAVFRRMGIVVRAATPAESVSASID